MTLRDWKDVLLPSEVKALEDCGYTEERYRNQEISRDEVFEAVIAWSEGIWQGFQIKNLIFRVYGIQL